MKLLPLLLFSCLLICSCDRDEKVPDAVAKAVGRYRVTTYAINGDTLFSSTGVNKNALEDFYIYAQRVASDSILLGVHYRVSGGTHNSVFWRPIAVDIQAGDRLALLPAKEQDSLYEGLIENGEFREWAGNGQSGVLALGENMTEENMNRLAALKPGRMEILIVAKKEK